MRRNCVSLLVIHISISYPKTPKAKLIAALTGGELYEIQQAQPCSEEDQICIAEAKADLQKKACPELLNLPDNTDACNEIYLGYQRLENNADGGVGNLVRFRQQSARILRVMFCRGCARCDVFGADTDFSLDSFPQVR